MHECFDFHVSLNVVVDNSFWHVFECDAVVRPLCPLANPFVGVFVWALAPFVCLVCCSSLTKRKSGWGICGSSGWFCVILVCCDLPAFPDLLGLCTNDVFTAYAHVRTEPQCDIGHRGKKKSLQQVVVDEHRNSECPVSQSAFQSLEQGRNRQHEAMISAMGCKCGEDLRCKPFFCGRHPLPLRRVAFETPEWTEQAIRSHHRQFVSAGKTNAIPTEPSGRLRSSGARLQLGLLGYYQHGIVSRKAFSIEW